MDADIGDRHCGRSWIFETSKEFGISLTKLAAPRTARGSHRDHRLHGFASQNSRR